MLFINGSNREKNCFNILCDIKGDKDEIISLSKKDIKFCLGCNSCKNELDNYCVLNDYITCHVYKKIEENEKIILASPLYMSNITGLLKNMIDRLNPFYHHDLLRGKKIFLILTGQGTYVDNEEEIKAIIDYFKGISEWLNFEFEFLHYFTSGDLFKVDDVRVSNDNYNSIINDIKTSIMK